MLALEAPRSSGGGLCFRMLVVGVLLALGWPGSVYAHDRDLADLQDLWAQHHWDPGVALALLVVTLVYLAGAKRLGRSFQWRAFAYLAGVLTLAGALGFPLDVLSQRSLTAHMTQHMLLVLVAAPLIVYGRPWVVGLLLAPRLVRQRILRLSRQGWLALALGPVAAWLMHALALWVWHAPRLYEAALLSEAVHLMEHASFFFTAIIFWLAMFPPRAARGHSPTLAIVLLFTFSLQGGLLGALMAFSPQPWYPLYLASDPSGALRDQQLAGMIMWVPGGLVYLGATLAVLVPLLREDEQRPGCGTLRASPADSEGLTAR